MQSGWCQGGGYSAHPAQANRTSNKALAAAAEQARTNPKLLFKIPPEFHDCPPVFEEYKKLLNTYGHIFVNADTPLFDHLLAKVRVEMAPCLELLPLLEEGLVSCQDTLLLLRRLQRYLETRMDAYYDLPVDTLLYDVPRNLTLYLDILRQGKRKPGILVPASKLGRKTAPKPKTGRVYKMKGEEARIKPFGEGVQVDWPARPPLRRGGFQEFKQPEGLTSLEPPNPYGPQVPAPKPPYRSGGLAASLLFNRRGVSKRWSNHVVMTEQHIGIFMQLLSERVFALKKVFEGRDLIKMLQSLIDGVEVIRALHARALRHAEELVHFLATPKELPGATDRMQEVLSGAPFYQHYIEDLRVASLHPALTPRKQAELFDALLALEKEHLHPTYPVLFDFFESVWMLYQESEYVVDGFDVKGFVSGYMFDKLEYSDGVAEVCKDMQGLLLLSVRECFEQYFAVDAIKSHFVTEAQQALALVGKRMVDVQPGAVARALAPAWGLAAQLLALAKEYTSPIKPKDLRRSEAGFVVTGFEWDGPGGQRSRMEAMRRELGALYGPLDAFEQSLSRTQAHEQAPAAADGIQPESRLRPDLTGSGAIARQKSARSLAAIDRWANQQHPKRVTSAVSIAPHEAASRYERGTLHEVWTTKKKPGASVSPAPGDAVRRLDPEGTGDAVERAPATNGLLT